MEPDRKGRQPIDSIVPGWDKYHAAIQEGGLSEFLLMASPDGDVMIPATFHGEARLVFGPVPGVFHAEIVYTFDLLTRLGFVPVPPAHPD